MSDSRLPLSGFEKGIARWLAQKNEHLSQPGHAIAHSALGAALFTIGILEAIRRRGGKDDDGGIF